MPPMGASFGSSFGIELLRDLVDERRDRDELEVAWPRAKDDYLFAQTDVPRAAPPLWTHRGERRIGQHGKRPVMVK
jgi:hypothetical protein